jgi:hypothetical protein
MIDVKTKTAEHLSNEFNIDPNVTALLFDKGILSFTSCRDMLIREEYRRKAQSKEKNRLKNKLAEKYCLSFGCIEKIIKSI